MSGCAECRLIPFLARGLLGPAEEARLRAHLAGCAECPAELRAEEHLTETLRAGIQRPVAPADLRASIADRMRLRPTPARRPKRAIFATAALLLLAIAASVSLRLWQDRDPLAVAARHAAAAHLSLDRQRERLQVEGSDAASRLSDLGKQTGLPAATAFHGDPELRLVAARQGRALGKVSALLAFLDSRGRLVTLELLPGDEITIPRERTRTVDKFHPMLTRADQVGVALWKQGKTFYVLTAPLDEDELARLYLKVRLGTS